MTASRPGAAPSGPASTAAAPVVTSRPRGDIVVDATGLLCPMPIVELADAFRHAEVGQVIEISATDFGLLEDAPAWAATTGHEIIGQLSEGERHTFWLRKLHD